jgi:hypothetical protein
MHTIVFVEQQEDEGRMVVGYQLNRKSFYRVPQGRIRIARFTSAFAPEYNLGYYGDNYFFRMVRTWKKRKCREMVNQILQTRLCHDMIACILEYVF